MKDIENYILEREVNMKEKFVDIKIYPDYTEVGDQKVYPRRILIITESGKEFRLEIKIIGNDPENLKVSLSPAEL